MSFSDNFNRPDGGLGLNWDTPAFGSAQILSNTVVGNATPCLVGVQAGGVPNINQLVALTALGSSGINGGPAVRINTTGGGQGYVVTAEGSGVASDVKIHKVTGGGTYTTLATSSVVPATNDRYTIQVVGTAISVTWGANSLNASDSAIASGEVGMSFLTASGNNWDDFFGDAASSDNFDWLHTLPQPVGYRPTIQPVP